GEQRHDVMALEEPHGFRGHVRDHGAATSGGIGAGVPASLAWLPSYFFAARKPLTTAIRLATRTMIAAPV
ncbi:hypothetical protein AB0F05_15390, partial [Streptomyces microflavus]|uniref:hypothetical protein n=1 Tax=Streptomyces microflavus TaxID=1919 RepID=UPI0033C93D90